MGTEENKITREIIEYLRTKQIFHFRNNTGRRGKVSYGYPGSADILGLLPSGRFLAIEVKVPGKTQNNNQILFESNINLNQGLYILAYSLEDVTNII